MQKKGSYGATCLFENAEQMVQLSIMKMTGIYTSYNKKIK